jgi:hypothetical protein
MTARRGHHHGRRHGRLVPSAAAVIFTCDACAGEYFPTPPPKVSELGLDDQPGDPPGDWHAALVHSGCAADFVANEFELVPDIIEGTNYPGLFCPHLAEAADE